MNKKDTNPEEFSYSGNNLDDLLNGLSTGSQSKAPAPQKKTPAAAASEQEHLHDGHRERLRQKFAEGMSFDGLSDHEIIELLLFYCIPRADVNELAHKLLRLFGGFTGVLNASYSQLCAVTGLGEQSAMYLKILMRLCAKYNLEMQQCISVTNAESLYDYMIYQFSGEADECAKLFLVDKQGKLGTPQAKSAVDAVVADKLAYWLEENGEQSVRLIRKMMKAAMAREAARRARDDARKGKKTTRNEKILSGKLAPAQTRDAAHKELFLVEGDSAGGSAKQGRDSRYQAILPLRGKVLNTEKCTMSEIEKNLELNTLIHAIDAGVGPSFDYQASNYSKIIIMTDADDDGSHIQILLLTFFYRYMRPLLEQGMVYIALPPLYKVTKGKQTQYCYTDDELDAVRKKLGRIEVQRYKGLGEMNATQLWETTMDPASRTLIRVGIQDEMLADKRVSVLMGDKADRRRKWIEDNISFTLEDDFKVDA